MHWFSFEPVMYDDDDDEIVDMFEPVKRKPIQLTRLFNQNNTDYKYIPMDFSGFVNCIGRYWRDDDPGDSTKIGADGDI